MNYREFYDVAAQLGSKKLPAELRSATSRAYYAAFHSARALFVGIGISLPVGPECHTKLRFLMANAGDSDLLAASRSLSSLRTDRNVADYQLDEKDAENSQTVTLNLRRARQVLDCVNQCFAGGAKVGIHAAVRKYAKDVLKLQVI